MCLLRAIYISIYLYLNISIYRLRAPGFVDRPSARAGLRAQPRAASPSASRNECIAGERGRGEPRGQADVGSQPRPPHRYVTAEQRLQWARPPEAPADALQVLGEYSASTRG
jgi:hypothetical protein